MLFQVYKGNVEKTIVPMFGPNECMCAIRACFILLIFHLEVCLTLLESSSSINVIEC